MEDESVSREPEVNVVVVAEVSADHLEEVALADVLSTQKNVAMNVASGVTLPVNVGVDEAEDELVGECSSLLYTFCVSSPHPFPTIWARDKRNR